MAGCSVLVCLIGSRTAYSRWCRYEIDLAKAQGKGILGVRIHGIRNQAGQVARPGPIPANLEPSIATPMGTAIKRAAGYDPAGIYDWHKRRWLYVPRVLDWRRGSRRGPLTETLRGPVLSPSAPPVPLAAGRTSAVRLPA